MSNFKSREEWKARLREINVSPMGFALACRFSMSTLNKLFKNDPNDPVHPNTLDRAMETYGRLSGESRAAG